VGDEFNNAVHVIDVGSTALVTTLAIGIPPCSVAFLDDETVVSMELGYVVFSDIVDPFAPPDFFFIDELDEADDFALDPTISSRIGCSATTTGVGSPRFRAERAFSWRPVEGCHLLPLPPAF
jgi:hypothetical protein